MNPTQEELDNCYDGSTLVARGKRWRIRERYSCGVVARAHGATMREARLRAEAIHARLHKPEGM